MLFNTLLLEHPGSVNTDPVLLLFNHYYNGEGWSSSIGLNGP